MELLFVLQHLSLLTSLGLVGSVIATFYYCSVWPGEWLAWWAKLINGAYQRATLGKPLGLKDEGNNRCSIDYGDEDAQKRFERYQWLLKPILTCERCIGGQVGFWLCVTLLFSLHTFSLLALLYVAGLASIGSGLLVKLIRL